MPLPRLTLTKRQRVLRGADFGRILRQGSCVADGVLVLNAMKSADGGPPRLGVTIPKKAGCAVVRNRWKRLIRESFRTHQHDLPRGYDFVVRPKKGATPRGERVLRSLPRLATRAVNRIR